MAYYRRSIFFALTSFFVTAALWLVLYRSLGEQFSLPYVGRSPVCQFAKHHGPFFSVPHQPGGRGHGNNSDMSLFWSSKKKHATNQSEPEPLFTPPLRTEGRIIVDANDRRFKLASINWYGASDVLFIPGGLDVRHRSELAATIRRMGFNSVRLPYSDELVLCNPRIESHLVPANPDLVGKRAIDVFEAVVTALTDEGIAVIVNNHITHAGWFDGFSLCDAGWSNDHLGPLCRITQTEDSWITNWQELMKRFVDNPLIIGADLRNEIHGFWGTMKWKSWAPAAEKVSEALLKMQPNWLMFVEGTSSANDLSGVHKRPIKLSIPNRVVYSSHVYSWSGWGDLDPYRKRSWPSFKDQMNDNWGFILEEDIAPVWVGEFGNPRHAEEGDLNYWSHLMRYLSETDADWGYWALNPRKPGDNSNETYSILQHDWRSEYPHDYRMRDMRQLTVDKKDRKETWKYGVTGTDDEGSRTNSSRSEDN